MKVRAVMYQSLLKMDESATVDQAVKMMDDRNIGSLLVEVDGSIQGIVTSRDVLRKVVVKGLIPNAVTVGEIMASPLLSVDAEAPIQAAADLMSEKNVRRLVVSEAGQVVGMISLKLIGKNLKYLQSREFIAEHLNKSVAAAFTRD